jgi:hypothetical protein
MSCDDPLESESVKRRRRRMLYEIENTVVSFQVYLSISHTISYLLIQIWGFKNLLVFYDN